MHVLCQANATAAGHIHLQLAFGWSIKDVCTKEGGNRRLGGMLTEADKG